MLRTSSSSRAASAITYVDPTDPPQFLVLGSEDTLVPLAQMTRFRDRLLASCVPAYFLLVEDAPHSVARTLGDEEIQLLLAFLEAFVESLAYQGANCSASGTPPQG